MRAQRAANTLSMAVFEFSSFVSSCRRVVVRRVSANRAAR
jgi:hypothetical protein